MDNKQPGKAKKWPFAVLATVVAAGGVYALPQVFADESAGSRTESAQTQTSSAYTAQKVQPSSAAVNTSLTNTSSVSPNLQPTQIRTSSGSTAGNAEVVLPIISVDPKKASASASRSALLQLQIMSLKTEQYLAFGAAEKQSIKLIEARNRATEVFSDPNAPADRVFSSSRKLEEAIDRYNDEALGGANTIASALAKAQTQILNGRSESDLDASGKLALQGLREAQARLNANSTEAGALSAYKYFLLRSAEANDIQSFNPADYSTVLKQYEANIKARTEAAGSYAKAADKLKKAYDVSAKSLASALERSSGKNALDAAQASVKVTYDALNEGLTLAEEIVQARPLLDSPAGKEKGQYGASKIGTLKRAIGKAERSLKTSKTIEPLKEARTKLAAAVTEFKNSRNS
ncbi:hypothetical protein [Saccharibacillus qingshengii]|uniref:hypothetical protein n=1 Tax=Saccharibacillus qingshengii TaxID=1763540 RepID=UPI0015573A9C|nr:hypothetical protein [Saccharibacillus qingshengii]